MKPAVPSFGYFCLLSAWISAAASAQPAAPVVWDCRIERVIENGRTTLLDDEARATPAGRFVFSADAAASSGCLLDPAGGCARAFTSAVAGGGVLRLAVTDPDGALDLVNIFTSTGRFIRIHGQTQWMGQQGDCTRRKG
jgi:hypothetical protein